MYTEDNSAQQKLENVRNWFKALKQMLQIK